jgi:hypothetical protein
MRFSKEVTKLKITIGKAGIKDREVLRNARLTALAALPVSLNFAEHIFYFFLFLVMRSSFGWLEAPIYARL